MCLIQLKCAMGLGCQQHIQINIALVNIHTLGAYLKQVTVGSTIYLHPYIHLYVFSQCKEEEKNMNNNITNIQNERVSREDILGEMQEYEYNN